MTTNQQIRILANVVFNGEESKETRKALKRMQKLQLVAVHENLVQVLGKEWEAEFNQAMEERKQYSQCKMTA